MSEDDFHEIQLNGKQLVFLFMSATVVAVVIFLCGVMVGRGVRAPRAAAEPVEAAAEPATDPTAAAQPAVTAAVEGTPAAAQETLTYPDRLEDAAPPPETLRAGDASSSKLAPAASEPAPSAFTSKTPEPAPKVASQPPAPKPTAKPPVSAPAAVATASVPAPKTPAVAPASEPKGNGFVVQVAATRDRAEADTIARRLTAKGYPAFVTTGGASMFRVRVGKYPERRDAETVAHKLQKDEQFKPWITK